jgi:hypothetical protein
MPDTSEETVQLPGAIETGGPRRNRAGVLIRDAPTPRPVPASSEYDTNRRTDFPTGIVDRIRPTGFAGRTAPGVPGRSGRPVGYLGDG